MSIDHSSDNLTFQAQDKLVEELLFSNLRYKIPRYQRSYSWEEDHIIDFWNDLLNPATNFIGSFVLNYESIKEDGYIEIIDGQQRLLTITIFMAVLRDIALSLNDPDCANRIQRQCIAFEDKRGTQTYRISSGESTRDFFEKYIQNKSNDVINSAPKTKEEKKIKNNYISLKTKVISDLESFNDKIRKIERIHFFWDL